MKQHLLHHFKALQQSAQIANATVTLDCVTFEVRVQHNKWQTCHTLYPQFISFRDGVKQYLTELSQDATVFAGWRPYPPTRIPSFKDKLQFKTLSKQNGLLTPSHWSLNESPTRDFLIKPRASAFGEGIHGPYPSHHAMTSSTLRFHDHYLEAFIPGRIVKIWFWSKHAVCYEIQDMPRVKGDGVRTIEAILKQRVFIRNTTIDYRRLFEVLDYYECDKDTVLAKDQLMTVDFRYASPLARRNAITEYVAPFEHDQPIQSKTLDQIGNAMWSIVNDEHGQALAYTIDAILDDQQQLWLLDANSNPMLHPCLYPLILCGLMGIHATPYSLNA